MSRGRPKGEPKKRLNLWISVDLYLKLNDHTIQSGQKYMTEAALQILTEYLVRDKSETLQFTPE